MTRGGALSRDSLADARALHASLLIVDGHCDTALDAIGLGVTDPGGGARDITVRSDRGLVDVPRLLEAGVCGQFFAMYTVGNDIQDPRAHAWRMLTALEAAMARSGQLRLATKAADVLRAKVDGAVAAFLAIEGGEAIGESLDELRSFHRRGVRLMTLTWNHRNAIARGVGAPPPGGLTAFGQQVVALMEELGMIVDVSHLADEALDDVLRMARRPLVASHSNAKAVHNHRRNLTDDQARRIADTGGLIGLTFAGVFIDADPAKVTLERTMQHLDRLVSAAGIEHVGLGTDFDGFTRPYGMVMRDCTDLPELTAAMLARGYTPDAIARIMGGNWLRVIGEILG
jgi:membrane dipeptidase